jgi:outer membrane lipoprotein SlyB
MKPKKEATGLERAKNTDHVLVDVGTVSGAVTGAIVGIVGGAPGMIVGGAIGAAIGTVAGAALDRESHAGERHDRELDDDIGVTNGELSAKEAIRASFASKQEMAEAHRRELEAELEEKTG